MVEKGTNGNVKVQIYPNNQLGAEIEYCEGVMLGTIEMAMSGNMWEQYVSIFKVNQLPYMFVNYDHANAVLNGPIGAEINKSLEAKGVKVLASFPNGFRVISNNKRAINSIEDARGVKLRVFEGEVIIKEIKALGFSPVVMPISEVFTAIQQGVVDGQDNPLATSYYSGFYEIQKHVAITNHMYSPGYIVINKKTWDRLSTAEQKLVQKAADETAADILTAVRSQDDEIIKDITSKGVKVTHPNLKPFIERVQPIIDEYIKEYPIIKRIQELGEKYL